MANANTFEVKGELTIYRAAELRPQLLEAAQADDLVVRLADVTEIDTAGIQLLLAAARSTRLQLEAPSEVVEDALRLLGLGQHFERS